MSKELDAMRRLPGESQITAKQAVHHFPWVITVRSVQRYCLEGRKLPVSNQTIFLESYRNGKGWVTSIEAVRRFLDHLNGAEE